MANEKREVSAPFWKIPVKTQQIFLAILDVNAVPARLLKQLIACRFAGQDKTNTKGQKSFHSPNQDCSKKFVGYYFSSRQRKHF